MFRRKKSNSNRRTRRRSPRFEPLEGRRLLAAQPVPLFENFAGGLPQTSDGWEYRSTSSGRIRVVSGDLQMDSARRGRAARNEAILHLNLAGKTGVKLRFDHSRLGDEAHRMPSSFRGSHNSDGVAFSADGINWHKLTDLSGDFRGRSFDLDAAARRAGVSYTSDFLIKFQQYDNYPAPTDGREIDNIAVTVDQTNATPPNANPPSGGVTPQSIPLRQDFSGGKPGASRGWEHHSTNRGRVQVVSGRLQMDSSTRGNSALNESILHLNLAGKTGVRLRFDHARLGDEAHRMPSSFRGSHHSDGVAFSADGINWHKLTDLSGDFRGRSFDLDAAARRAGVSYTSDFLIKFQQYDNYPAPTDGRSFDNIAVTTEATTPTPPSVAPPAATTTPQSVPLRQNFSQGKPSSNQGWEYHSSSSGRIQVVSGRLQMDSSTRGRYALNESILHLNLAGKTGVTLRFDHTRIGDEFHPMPSQFRGSHQSDGVAISADGVNWHKLTDLDRDFRARSFDLDAAARRAGIGFTTDFLIKFQQYDNYSAPTDGRAVDNIVIAEAPSPSAPGFHLTNQWQGISVHRNGQQYVTTIDLSTARMQSLTGSVNGSGQVSRQTMGQFWNEANRQGAGTPRVLINGVFFNTQKDPTDVSFGLKVGGRTISVGNDVQRHNPDVRMFWLDSPGGSAGISSYDRALFNTGTREIVTGLSTTHDKRYSTHRTFLGYSPATRRLYLYSSGDNQTQAHAESILRAFGAQQAMQLDGGGSTGLVIDGQTKINSRAVPHAIAFFE